MMSVGLSVGRDVEERRIRLARQRGIDQARGEPLAVLQQPLERHFPRNPPVVEEEGHIAAADRTMAVTAAEIARSDVPSPRRVPRRTNGGELPRRKDREPHACLGKDIEALGVGGRLGKPHPLGGPSEHMAELGQAPQDLRSLVAAIQQGKYRVVVRLRDRVSVPEAQPRIAIGIHQRGQRGLAVPRHPIQQRRPEIERETFVIVDDRPDALTIVQDTRGAVRCVAFAQHARIPIMEGPRRGLGVDALRPGVFARGLIEVSVNDDVSHLDILRGGSRQAQWERGETGGKRKRPGSLSRSGPRLICGSWIRQEKPGSVLLSHTLSGAVPSALRCLTSVFGMGTGVAPRDSRRKNSVRTARERGLIPLRSSPLAGRRRVRRTRR